MEFTEVKDILENWTILAEEIDKFCQDHPYKKHNPHMNNARRAIFLFYELMDYLTESLPLLEQWMNEYLAKNKKEIFIRWWGEHVPNWAEDQLQRFSDYGLYPNVQEEWDAVFGENRATCFSLAHSFALELRSKRSMEKCDNPTILAIHEGLDHDGDWYGCDLCDDQEHQWHAELLHRLQTCAHPLLNKNRRTRLLWGWNKHSLEHWSPPHAWGVIHDTHRSGEMCYQLDVYKATIDNSDTKAIKQGYTRIQAIRPFLWDAFGRGKLQPPFKYTKQHDKPYESFVFLWNRLGVLPFCIELFTERMKMIEKLG